MHSPLVVWPWLVESLFCELARRFDRRSSPAAVAILCLLATSDSLNGTPPIGNQQAMFKYFIFAVACSLLSAYQASEGRSGFASIAAGFGVAFVAGFIVSSWNRGRRAK